MARLDDSPPRHFRDLTPLEKYGPESDAASSGAIDGWGWAPYWWWLPVHKPSRSHDDDHDGDGDDGDDDDGDDGDDDGDDDDDGD